MDRSTTAYLTAREVSELIGIKPQTVYAYVSRGWLRAIAQPATREKLYLRDDVEKLRTRSSARAGHGASAAAALRWGEPVITSSITEITLAGPRYRGHLATQLARQGCSFEATADLLWTGMWDQRTVSWSRHALPPGFSKVVASYLKDFSPQVLCGRFAMIVQLLADTQGGNPEVALGTTIAAARQILQVIAGSFGLLEGGSSFVDWRPGDYIADVLTRALGLEESETLRHGLDAALTLAADHELALPSFVARVVASSGANLNACVLSGIMAFEGPLTGIGTSGVEDLVLSCGSKAKLKKEILLACKQGRQLAGFDHPLYPQGDPRAQYLMDFVRMMKQVPASAHALLEVLDELRSGAGIFPGFPAGLVALQLALGLPPRCASALFLLGRIAGLAAHVQEQRLAAFFIRPRAKYVG